MTERERLLTLAETLPEPEVHTAVRFLEYLNRELSDPVRTALENAPFDEEPLSSADLEALEEARRDLLEGRVVSHEEARKRLLAGS
jgi:predicted transcriptional regulator